MSKTFTCFIFFALVACGHTTTILEKPLPSQGIPEPLPEKIGANEASGECQNFAQSVFSFTSGVGAGFGQARMPGVVLGPPRGRGSFQGSFDVLSLGIGGEVILDVGNCHIVDKAGVDFIIFENTFWVGGNPEAPFKELGIVSVSLDGENFVAFPCQAAQAPYTGCAGWHPVYSNTDNDISPFDVDEAGGDSFDLADINVSETKYVRIQETGGGGFAPSLGFDLDAIAIIHGTTTN